MVPFGFLFARRADTVKQNRSKAIDMRFYWRLKCRQQQQQFKIYSAPGRVNLADYFTKHTYFLSIFVPQSYTSSVFFALDTLPEILNNPRNPVSIFVYLLPCIYLSE